MAKARRSLTGRLLKLLMMRSVSVNHICNPGAVKISQWRIVGVLSVPLHFDEMVTEPLDILREPAHGRAVLTLVSGVTMFQGTVGLFPSRLTAAGAGCAGQSVGAAPGQRMEHGVVGGADGPA